MAFRTQKDRLIWFPVIVVMPVNNTASLAALLALQGYGIPSKWNIRVTVSPHANIMSAAFQMVLAPFHFFTINFSMNFPLGRGRYMGW